jgi:hypothetical protein
MNVKGGRLQPVIGLLLVMLGLAVLVGWVVIGPTVYNSIPFLGAGLVAVGVAVNRRGYRG